MANYKVSIAMDEQTAQDLFTGGYNLFAFRAVKGAKTGSPVVWQVKDKNQIFNQMFVDWEENYGAFFGSKDQTIITGRTDITLDLGQKLIVDDKGYHRDIGAPAGTITVANKRDVDYLCGISEYRDGNFNPLCKFPLPKQMASNMAPIQQVVLLFATDVVTTATVVEQAASNGIVVNLTKKNQRVVSFKNNKWSSSDPDGIQYFDADASLSDYLIYSNTDEGVESDLSSRVDTLEKKVKKMEAHYL